MSVVYRLRSLSVAIIVAAAALAVTGTQPALSVHSPELRPDLLELEPKDFSIQTMTSGEQRLLYDLETANGHTGPLEVFPTKQKCAITGQTADGRTVRQRVYQDSNGNGYFDRGTDTQADIYTVGCMAFHRFHHHWHFDALVGSFLWSLDENGARVAEVASSPKQSFCLADVHQRQDLFDPDLPGAPANPYYRDCGRNSTQGLSVAWSDEYSSNTPGQYLVVTGLTGDFCFVATADPLAKLVEVSDANNTDSIKIHLSGASVTEYPGSTC